VFLLWDVVVLGLVPFVIKNEDIRLVSIKNRVDDSSCLTHFRTTTRLTWEMLSLNPSIVSMAITWRQMCNETLRDICGN
jgi:hypothetical protein